MGCQPTVCRICHHSFPACQIQNGVCAGCRAKEQQAQKEAQNTPPPPKQEAPVTNM